MFVLSVTISEIITYELPNVLHSNFLNLKFKEDKGVDDLSENWPANVPYQHAYVRNDWRF